MTDMIAVFGYGSLVNQATLPAGTTSIPGTLSGFRRAWRIAGKTPIGHTCGLTAEADVHSAVRGTLILYPRADLSDLDAREWRYDRHEFDLDAFAPDAGHADAIPKIRIVYRVKPEHERWGDENHPVIQSYVDCVLRGYFERWGVLGVRHFVETTAGWQVPIRRDRSEPRYRRAVRITAEEENLFDRILAEAGARWID